MRTAKSWCGFWETRITSSWGSAILRLESFELTMGDALDEEELLLQYFFFYCRLSVTTGIVVVHAGALFRHAVTLCCYVACHEIHWHHWHMRSWVLCVLLPLRFLNWLSLFLALFWSGTLFANLFAFSQKPRQINKKRDFRSKLFAEKNRLASNIKTSEIIWNALWHSLAPIRANFDV